MELEARKVRVVGLEWTIETGKIKDHPTTETRGYTDAPTRTIMLEEEFADDGEELWHELIHALEYAFNIALEESEVQAIARGQLAICRDNPWLKKYLFPKAER